MRSHPKLLAVVLFLLVFWAAFEISGLRDHFSLEFLKHRIQENRVTGLLIFVLLFTLGNLIQVPGWIFLAAAVVTMGQGWGGLATYLAACVSCVVTFLVIRRIGGDALRGLKHQTARRILGRLDAHPVKGVVILRVLFQTLPAVNYALAMSGIRFRQYLTGTLLGLPLPIFLICLFSAELAKWLRIG